MFVDLAMLCRRERGGGKGRRGERRGWRCREEEEEKEEEGKEKEEGRRKEDVEGKEKGRRRRVNCRTGEEIVKGRMAN